MTFIKYEDGSWWELNKDTRNNGKMRVYNIRGGYHYINEKELETLVTKEFDSWHDLYKQTGFNPLIGNDMWYCGWISPDGDFYPCEAHEVDAEDIYVLLYGEEHGYYSDLLIEKGWKKVTNSLMFDIYKDNGDYDNFSSNEQFETFYNWCKNYKMKY